MKILLVVPKYTYTNLTKSPNYDYYFPIGLGYIVAVLKKEGYDIDCLNLNHFYGTIEELLNNQLNKIKYDFVLSGHMGIGYAMIEKIISISKNHPSKPKIIIGGPLITSEPELMAQNLSFDFGVIGEGERTIIELLRCLEKKKDVNKVDGVVYKDENKKIIITKKREPIKDLDSLPFPDFEALGLDEQLKNMSSEDVFFGYFDYPKVYQILGSRGCPFQCTFCYHILGDNSYRTRSVKNIIAEIRYAVKRFKINGVNLNDDMFSYDRERLKEFCYEMKKIIKETPWEFKWACSLSVNKINEELLKLMKESGCLMIGWGLESYSPAVLKSMKKPITPEQIDNAIQLCLKLKILNNGNFIFGDVAETKETAKETMDYWKKNCRGQVKLFFIHPYPGSEIFKHCIQKGIIKDKLDYIKNKIQHTNILNMTNNMNDNEFNQLVREVWKNSIKYSGYVPAIKIKKSEKEGCEDFTVKCPFCGIITKYKNCIKRNKFYYSHHIVCRNPECNMRFFFASHLYTLTIKYYKQFDFLRKNYLYIRENLLKKKL